MRGDAVGHALEEGGPGRVTRGIHTGPPHDRIGDATVALNTQPDWRCTARVHFKRRKPPAIAIVRARDATFPDLLLRCTGCLDDLKESGEPYDIDYLASRLQRRPDLDRVASSARQP